MGIHKHGALQMHAGIGCACMAAWLTVPGVQPCTCLLEHKVLDAHGRVEQQRRQEGVQEDVGRFHPQEQCERVAQLAQVHR